MVYADYTIILMSIAFSITEKKLQVANTSSINRILSTLRMETYVLCTVLFVSYFVIKLMFEIQIAGEIRYVKEYLRNIPLEVQKKSQSIRKFLIDVYHNRETERPPKYHTN